MASPRSPVPRSLLLVGLLLAAPILSSPQAIARGDDPAGGPWGEGHGDAREEDRWRQEDDEREDDARASEDDPEGNESSNASNPANGTEAPSDNGSGPPTPGSEDLEASAAESQPGGDDVPQPIATVVTFLALGGVGIFLWARFV